MSFNAKGHGSETRAIPKARNTVYFGELCNALCRGFGLVTGDVHISTSSRFSSADGEPQGNPDIRDHTRPSRMKVNTFG
jgi:hypothetical protein